MSSRKITSIINDEMKKNNLLDNKGKPLKIAYTTTIII